MSGGSARTIRRHSVELWQGLVLHGVRKFTFQHLTVNCHFNVVEMGVRTLHFVQGLSRTPLLFIPRYLTNLFFKNILQKQNISRINNLKLWKSPNPGSLTGAQYFRNHLVIIIWGLRRRMAGPSDNRMEGGESESEWGEGGGGHKQCLKNHKKA